MEPRAVVVPNLTLSQMVELVRKMGGERNVRRFLKDELKVVERVPHWSKPDDLIRLTVTSSGRSDKEWISQLMDDGWGLDEMTTRIIESALFQATRNVSYRVVIIPGNSLKAPTIKAATAKACKLKLRKPPIEVGCLLREDLLDSDLAAMGLKYVAAVHDPFCGGFGTPYYLTVISGGMEGAESRSDQEWAVGAGFAFIV